MFAARKHMATAVSRVIKGSALFSSNYIYLPNATAAASLSLPADFTIEFWVRPTSTSNFAVIFGTTIDYTTASGLRIGLNANTLTVIVASVGSGLITASSALTLNQWTHVAVVRSGSTLTLYYNGSSVGSVSNSTSFVADNPIMGNITGPGSPYYWLGYISNLRVVKGTAVYTSTFTAPTTPLTAISGTQLLTFQSPLTITDASTNNHTLANIGGTTASSLSPFA